MHRFTSSKSFDKHSEAAIAMLDSEFYKSLTKDPHVPFAIKRLYPTFSEDKLLTKLVDPNFLYESVKLCSDCYDCFKVLLSLIKSCKKKTELSQREEVKKSLPSIPKSQPTALPRLYKL